jgi:hypothetical protein
LIRLEGSALVDTKSLRTLLRRAEALFRGSAASQQADALGKFATVLDEADPRSVDDFVDRVRPPPPPAPPLRAEEVVARLEEIHQGVDEAAFRALFGQLSERRFSKDAAIEVAAAYTGARLAPSRSKKDALNAIERHFRTRAYRAAKARREQGQPVG